MTDLVVGDAVATTAGHPTAVPGGRLTEANRTAPAEEYLDITGVAAKTTQVRRELNAIGVR